MASPKLLYTAHRHPGFTPAAFTARWRQHAALGMRQARWVNVARYLHGDRLDGLPAGVPQLDCDGVAIVVFRSEDHRLHHISQQASRMTMKADELETFNGPVGGTSLLTQDVPVCDVAEGSFKLFVFWQADGQDQASVDGFLAAWQARATGWLHSTGRIGHSPVRWVQNQPVQPRQERSAGLRCDGIDELSSFDLPALLALAQAWARDAALPAQPSMVLTRTVVLHDVPEDPAAP